MTKLDTPRGSAGQVAFGVAIMSAGLVILMDRLELFRPDDLTRFWPVLLVTFGLSRIIWPPRPGAEASGMWIALIGGLLLLDRANVAPLGESWPVLVIMAGLTVVFKAVGWLPSRRCWTPPRRWTEVAR
jgi:hypothetical protein